MDELNAQPPAGAARPPRRPLVPRAALVAGAIAGVALVGLAVAAILYASSFSIEVPDIVGESGGVARTQLSRAGLEYAVAESRFSAEPAGTVLEQTPQPGSMVRRGAVVSVVLSAGSEDVVMPDVIGEGIILARGKLEALGLEVRIEAEPSDVEPNTVLATFPAPGSRLQTGSLVRVTISAQGVEGSVLLPYALEGLVFSIDPAAPESDDSDPALDVSRRLRALLEASGASAVMTRSSSDPPDLAEDVRVTRSVEATPAVVIGFSAFRTGAGGLALLQPESGDDLMVADSRRLADHIAEVFAEDGVSVARESLADDAVLRSTPAPGVRVRLGSLASTDDVARFSDPAWADRVARAVYRAIGEVYGQ